MCGRNRLLKLIGSLSKEERAAGKVHDIYQDLVSAS